MVGAGYSDRDPALDCSLRAHAGRLLAFLDVQNIATADLVANSHGCAVAMMAAALATQRGEPRVRSFALANPVHPWATFHWPQQLLIKSDLLRAIVAPILFRSRTLQSRFLLRLYGDRSRITPDTLAGYVAPFALPGSMQYAAGIVKSWRSDLQELAALMQHIVDVPALVMWGTKDRAVRVESSAPLHQHFRNVKVVTFDGVGHLPMEEAPDRFNHEVIDFWNKLPA